MKKVLTILLAMSMMSCTFASCGKKESDKEDKKNLSADEEVHPAVGRWVPVEKEDTIFDIHSEDEAYICAVQDLSDDLYFEDDNFVFSGMEFSGDNYDFDGETFVLRFKSEGNENNKCYFEDVIRGKIEMQENTQDVVLLKTDGIPTYHFAHVVDQSAAKFLNLIYCHIRYLRIDC